jgi:hypothetical protein
MVLIYTYQHVSIHSLLVSELGQLYSRVLEYCIVVSVEAFIDISCYGINLRSSPSRTIGHCGA